VSGTGSGKSARLVWAMQPVSGMEPTPRTLSEIAREHPSATRVFFRHRLDFCCGGQRTLEQACAVAGLDPVEVEREIEVEVDRGDEHEHWDARPRHELADHIERHYHAALRRDVPPLIAAARKVEKVHARKPNVPVGLADALERFWDELESHMLKEELVLFPMIRRGVSAGIVGNPIAVMLDEHAMHGVQLASIRRLARGFEVPPEACATWTALYRGLETLEAELMQHIHLENNILFRPVAGARGQSS
jgi:regulator of cell morphogenesis and NO signaling